MNDPSQRSADADEFAGRTMLVTGGGGFLGRTVLEGLAETFPGRIISIHRRPLAAAGARLPAPHLEVRADLHDHERWCDHLHEVDYVFWMAALRDHGSSVAQAERENVEPLRAALSVLRNRPQFKRLVFTSTISAVDQPDHPSRPRPVTDDSPPYPRTPYGYSKLMSEQLLAASGVPHTILRLPFLYGPGFRSGSFLDFYRTIVHTPLLSALRFTGNLSLLYTSDVAGLLLEIIATRNVDAAGTSPYVLSDGSTYEVDDLVSLVAEVHGLRRPGRRVPASVGQLASAFALALRRVTRPQPVARSRAGLLATYWSHAAFTRDYFVVDSSRFHAALPHCTYTPVDAGIPRSFAPCALAIRPSL